MNELNVISLGAGKQSSYMLINALEGKYKYKPDLVVFADTGCEPKYVYEYLDWLEGYTMKNHGMPIARVSNGNLKQDIIDYLNGIKPRATTIPLRLENGGIIQRQCTYDYKIAPIRKLIKKEKKLLDINKVRLFIGISLDEIERIRESDVKYIENYYPLIENRITIDQILYFFDFRGFPPPGKSACLICPFHSFAYWSIMRRWNKREFDEACQFDDKIREYPGLKKRAYLSNQLKPLRDVNFSQHPSLFPEMIEECYGMCGL